MANSVDPDEMPHSAASHLGLNCLLRPVCPNTYGKYGTCIIALHKVKIQVIIQVIIDFCTRIYMCLIDTE